ncbi:unnamed protein product [Cladocopium goreaui]|uniref:Voltage-dependent T-type calcium channel subunit alpha-1I n=1 Tax=Cladocopium goreaui TaxID=2562237 RepID=A0A9P1BPL5_9DINO|nr:unnamed protein product [Cladocopium goreaui]
MAPKESFSAKQLRLKQQQEAEEDEATAERIEREMAEEINAQAEQNAFRIPAWVNIAGALLGVLQLSYRIEQERERRADDYFANPRPEIYSVVASMSFEVGVAFLIAINCVLLGWQASLPENENALLFDICEHIFVTIFLIEWCMRVIAFGWVWIFEFSNAADTVMVFIFGVFPKWVLDPLGINATFIRVFTVMRALRLARLARAVRLKPAFKELWILIHGLTTSFRPLMWTILIATIVLYLGGLAATEIIGKSELFLDEPNIQYLFGDLLKSMYTMIQLLTLDTWVDTIARYAIDPTFSANGKAYFPYCIFFVLFIGIGVFVFWNLITAIIVETAFAISSDDSNSQARELEMAKKAEIESLTQIFLEIDKDHSGELSFSEFENALNIPKVRQMLDVLGIQANELEEVWYVLDDGDNCLTIKEFTTGIRRMRGQAKAKDLADTVKRLRLATKSAKELLANADQFHSSLLHLEDECGRISDDTGRMVGLFHEMYHRLNSHLEICNKQNIQREAARKKAKLKAAQEEAMRAEANQPEDEDE